MASQWASWRLKSPATRRFIQPFVLAKFKENIKAHFTGLLWGETTGDRPVDSPHKWPVTPKVFPWYDVIMIQRHILDHVFDGDMLLLRIDRPKTAEDWHTQFTLSRVLLRWSMILMSFSLTNHCDDVIMGAMASQITSLTIVYSTVYSDADQRKHQSSASLAFVRGIHRTNGQ